MLALSSALVCLTLRQDVMIRHRQADKNATQGDFGEAMEALSKIDAKVNLNF